MSTADVVVALLALVAIELAALVALSLRAVRRPRLAGGPQLHARLDRIAARIDRLAAAVEQVGKIPHLTGDAGPAVVDLLHSDAAGVEAERVECYRRGCRRPTCVGANAKAKWRAPYSADACTCGAVHSPSQLRRLNASDRVQRVAHACVNSDKDVPAASEGQGDHPARPVAVDVDGPLERLDDVHRIGVLVAQDECRAGVVKSDRHEDSPAGRTPTGSSRSDVSGGVEAVTSTPGGPTVGDPTDSEAGSPPAVASVDEPVGGDAPSAMPPTGGFDWKAYGASVKVSAAELGIRPDPAGAEARARAGAALADVLGYLGVDPGSVSRFVAKPAIALAGWADVAVDHTDERGLAVTHRQLLLPVTDEARS